MLELEFEIVIFVRLATTYILWPSKHFNLVTFLFHSIYIFYHFKIKILFIKRMHSRSF